MLSTKSVVIFMDRRVGLKSSKGNGTILTADFKYARIGGIMKEGKKSLSEFVVDALISGQSLRLADITEKVRELSGRNVKIQDISSVLSKLSNNDKCELGYLIKKEKAEKGYVYRLVKEACSLEPEQLYDLTRKTGKNRFTLDEAIKKKPGLRKYVKAPKTKTASKKTEPKKADEAAPAKQSVSDQGVNIALAELERMLRGQGGLNVNVNLNVRFNFSDN